MTTIYSALRNNFTQVSNHALLDIRLSGKAYKLYAYMCYRIGLSDSWNFNKDEILKHFKEGEKAMRGAFDELIDFGFLERKRIRNSKGIFEKTDYVIYAEPVNTGLDPQVQKRHVDNRHVENPHVDNASYNNKEIINKELNNKDLSLAYVEQILRENNFKNVDGKKIFDYISREKNLRNSVENIVLKCAAKPENQLKASVESDLVIALRRSIKSSLPAHVNYVELFAGCVIENSTIYVRDKHALQYQKNLDKIGIKIELK